MNTSYAQVADCVDIIPSLADVTAISARLEASLFQSLLDASRLIETDLHVPLNYFTPAKADSTTRTFYYNGTSYVRLPPYTDGIVSIVDNDNHVVDSEMYRLNDFDVYSPSSYYLKWIYTSCVKGRWWNDPLQITARWGFPCIPPDIVLAVKSMGCLLLLTDPPTRNGLESELDTNLEQRLRGTYNKVLDTWLDKLRHQELGIG